MIATSLYWCNKNKLITSAPPQIKRCAIKWEAREREICSSHTTRRHVFLPLIGLPTEAPPDLHPFPHNFTRERKLHSRHAKTYCTLIKPAATKGRGSKLPHASVYVNSDKRELIQVHRLFHACLPRVSWHEGVPRICVQSIWQQVVD